MLKSWERKYFRDNEGYGPGFWRCEDQLLSVGDQGVAITHYDLDRKPDGEREAKKWTLTVPDEREIEYNRQKGSWILIDTYE